MTGPEKSTQNIAACSSYGTNSFSVAMAVASYVLYKFCMFHCIPYELYVTEFWEAYQICHTYSILFLHLISTFMHYPCTVPLPGLANCSAFLEQILLTM